tara:strand:+ start:203 stop:388 length:186 start_codon:yes stop_codon:yes gene_type:complete
MSDKYDDVQIVNILFKLVDNDGNVLRNKDGSEKLFQPNASCFLEHISEGFTPDMLEEVSDG